jgi:hypothetical protein
VPTILLEGEAYVVAMLGFWLWCQGVFNTSGKRRKAWWSGLLQQARIYSFVAALLAIAAMYEAIEVIWLAAALFSEYMRVALEITGSRRVAECLEEFAELALASGRAEQAARMFGAAQALRRTNGSVVEPVDFAA